MFIIHPKINQLLNVHFLYIPRKHFVLLALVLMEVYAWILHYVDLEVNC